MKRPLNFDNPHTKWRFEVWRKYENENVKAKRRCFLHCQFRQRSSSETRRTTENNKIDHSKSRRRNKLGRAILQISRCSCRICHKNHVSFGFSAAELQSEDRKMLEEKGYITGQKTLQIKFDQKVPTTAIKQILKAIAKMNEAKREIK